MAGTFEKTINFRKAGPIVISTIAKIWLFKTRGVIDDTHIQIERNIKVRSESDLHVFGETETTQLPLITIFGREPNSNVQRHHAVGKYADTVLQGQHWPSVDFWNNAYGLLGSYAELHAPQLQQRCKEKKISPIVLADLSPVALDSSYSRFQKREIRSEIPESEMRNHIDSVFSHREIFSRTRLVILSGHTNCGFKASAIRHLEQACVAADIPYCHIASLPAPISHVTRRAQLREYKPIIEQVMNEFLHRDPEAGYRQVA